MMVAQVAPHATEPLDLVADNMSQLEALGAFYRARREGLESSEAIRLALEAAKASAVRRCDAAGKVSTR